MRTLMPGYSRRFARLIIGTLLLLWSAFAWAAPITGSAPVSTAYTQGDPVEAGMTDRFLAWMLTQQRELHKRLTSSMESVRENPSTTKAGLLILVSFLYGVFHAAGPGHGKIVITTYLLSHRQHLGRALGLSLASSLLQGITAIVLVTSVLLIAGGSARSAMDRTASMELASFSLVALLGIWLMLRALRRMWTLGRQVRAADTSHEHDSSCGCGHKHHVDPGQAARVDGLGPLLATIGSVGIRPCTGAILILVVAHVLGIWLAGMIAVMVMSLGTAMTVCLLATLAVQARSLAAALVSRGGGDRFLQWGTSSVALAGGLLIFWVGASLFIASLGTSPPPLPGL